jgi:hypothetical protein
MRTFIQLRNGIGYATINTPVNAPDHSVTPDNTTAIEVESGTGEFYLNKKYEDGVWSVIDVIKWAQVDEDGVVVEIKRTYFADEVNGPLIDDTYTPNSKWIDNTWVPFSIWYPSTQPSVEL